MDADLALTLRALRQIQFVDARGGPPAQLAEPYRRAKLVVVQHAVDQGLLDGDELGFPFIPILIGLGLAGAAWIIGKTSVAVADKSSEVVAAMGDETKNLANSLAQITKIALWGGLGLLAYTAIKERRIPFTSRRI